MPTSRSKASLAAGTERARRTCAAARKWAGQRSPVQEEETKQVGGIGEIKLPPSTDILGRSAVWHCARRSDHRWNQGITAIPWEVLLRPSPSGLLMRTVGNAGGESAGMANSLPLAETWRNMSAGTPSACTALAGRKRTPFSLTVVAAPGPPAKPLRWQPQPRPP